MEAVEVAKLILLRGVLLFTAHAAPSVSLCGLWSCGSLRLVSVPLGLLFVAGYQGLEGGPQTGSLPLMVLTPCRPHLLLSSGVESPHALSVGGLELVGIHLPVARAALDHGVELLLAHLRVLYGVH
jgi:hypothetical protein